MSPQTVHFWVLKKSPLSGPGRDLPSCNIAPKKSIQQSRLFLASFPFLHQASHSYLNAFSLCSCLKCFLSLYLPNPTPIWNTNVSNKSLLIIRQTPFSAICSAFIISSTHYNILLYLVWSWHVLSWVLSIVPLIYLVSQNYTFRRIRNKFCVPPRAESITWTLWNSFSSSVKWK